MSRYFVDTNVFVYGRDASEPAKQPRAEAWVAWLWDSSSGRVSTQVLHELYVTLTRKLDPGLAIADARAEVRDLHAWRPHPLTTELAAAAWEVEDRFGLSFWDALIVAAAKATGCTHVLTEDLHDGLDLGGVVVLDPFTHEPGDRAD